MWSVQAGMRCCPRWFSPVLLGFIMAAWIGLMPHVTYGYDIYEEDKRQDLVPFPRVGRSGYWSEVKRQGLVPFPRVGRSITETKRQGLIPFPRMGRSAFAPDPDLTDDEGDAGDWEPTYDFGFLVVPYKRRVNNFTPRIGRKRRSITTDEDENRQEPDNTEMSQKKTVWNEVDYGFNRDTRQLIPNLRTGRSDGGIQMRAAFVPRLGRKRSGDVFDEFEDIDEDKRGAFTPRIGRAFTPRIGRAEYGISTRTAFTPRIGRTAFTPRIGRSDKGSSVSGTDDGKSAGSKGV